MRAVGRCARRSRCSPGVSVSWIFGDTWTEQPRVADDAVHGPFEGADQQRGPLGLTAPPGRDIEEIIKTLSGLAVQRGGFCGQRDRRARHRILLSSGDPGRLVDLEDGSARCAL